MNPLEKSIQELEQDYWPDQQEYVSSLVERCHRFRKIPIQDLEISQIITLLIQDIGSTHLMPLVLQRMEADLTEMDEADGRSFIDSLERFSPEIYKREPALYQPTMNLLKRKQADIEAIIGWKRYERLLNKMEHKAP